MQVLGLSSEYAKCVDELEVEIGQDSVLRLQYEEECC